MITLVVMTLVLVQGAGRLQPGAGIVTGALQLTSGGPAGGVRVGAIAVDDASGSDLLAVTETDSAGRYQLMNIPAGRYYIVAGRLNALTYFPAGTDRANAKAVSIEAAKVTGNIDFSVPAESRRPPPPPALTAMHESVGFEEIVAERNPAKKRQRLLKFVQAFPRSTRLAEVYIELSRSHAMQTDLEAALRYAERSIDATAKLSDANVPSRKDQAWAAWVRTIDESAKSNLAWVKQMIAWQRQGIQSSILRKR